MKKLILIALFLTLGLGLVLAAQEEKGQSNNSLEDKNDSIGKKITGNTENKTGIGQELNELIKERKEEIRNGNYTGPQGQFLRVNELAQSLKELVINNIAAKTSLNITAETDAEGKTKLKTKLKNGQELEIKIMPDTASQKALERLRLKVCSPDNNCTIQLKDVGSEKNEKIAYEVQSERNSKILGIFKKKMQVKAEVDAETGDTKVYKPWWAFLAVEPEE